MNRMKKEELKIYQQQSKGLSSEEVELLDVVLKIRQQIERLSESLRCHIFPEEFDFQFDDYADYTDRRREVNPMSQTYSDKMNQKRQNLGIEPLGKDGMCRSLDSKQYVSNIAVKLIQSKDINKDILAVNPN